MDWPALLVAAILGLLAVGALILLLFGMGMIDGWAGDLG